jgi:hypothetical protein
MNTRNLLLASAFIASVAAPAFAQSPPASVSCPSSKVIQAKEGEGAGTASQKLAVGEGVNNQKMATAEGANGTQKLATAEGVNADPKLAQAESTSNSPAKFASANPATTSSAAPTACP